MKKKLIPMILAAALCIGLVGTAIAATVQVTPDPTISVNVGGKEIDLENVHGTEVDPFNVGGTIYLPIRAISEALGYDVDWDRASNTVLVGEPTEVESVVANCTSEPYGKAIHSFTFHVNSTRSVMNLTAEDFQCLHFVYDGNEVHKPFDAKALDVSFTQNTVTVEVEPFYPDMSYTQEGYWTMTCTNPAFNVDAAFEISYSDPVVEAFDQFTETYGDATLDCYLYSPQNTEDPLPLVIFNSGGTGISTTGDLYGANFAVSFAKEEAQANFPCYVLYPQRNAGETDDLCAAIKGIADRLVAEGMVDADRIYMTGESAGSLFTMNFVTRYPGYNAAIAIFNGGGDVVGTTLEETVNENMPAPFSDADMQKLAQSGTKVMLVQSLGDTTSFPLKYATTYQKLVNYGMEPGVDVVWHYYTADKFNSLLNDRTYWFATADAGYVTDPITGVTTYYYPEGKLHNSSYPAANDEYIKGWLFDQRKGEYSVEFSDEYSALYNSTHTDYSIIPERYTKVAVLDNVPCVPAGQESTVTVYTNDDESFYYLTFETLFQPGVTQYVECIVVGNIGRVIMDSSGTWWTNDINNSTMPYLLSLDHIDWQPYIH